MPQGLKLKARVEISDMYRRGWNCLISSTDFVPLKVRSASYQRFSNSVSRQDSGAPSASTPESGRRSEDDGGVTHDEGLKEPQNLREA